MSRILTRKVYEYRCLLVNNILAGIISTNDSKYNNIDNALRN